MMTLLLTLAAMVCIYSTRNKSFPLNQLACAAAAHPGCAQGAFFFYFASRANPFHLSLLFMSRTWRLTYGSRRCSLKVITMMVIGANVSRSLSLLLPILLVYEIQLLKWKWPRHSSTVNVSNAINRTKRHMASTRYYLNTTATATAAVHSLFGLSLSLSG